MTTKKKGTALRPLPKKLGLYFPDKKNKEPIVVTRWEQWPSYDFIFGYPREDNPFYKEEAAYFEIRVREKMKNCKNGIGYYLDKDELDGMFTGFASIVLSRSFRLPPLAAMDSLPHL